MLSAYTQTGTTNTDTHTQTRYNNLSHMFTGKGNRRDASQTQTRFFTLHRVVVDLTQENRYQAVVNFIVVRHC